MREIVTYDVIEPPTSRGVLDCTFDALSKDYDDPSRGLVKLTLLSHQEVPKPEAQQVEFTVKQIHDHQLKGMRLVGPVATEGFGLDISVQLSTDGSDPAIASIVV